MHLVLTAAALLISVLGSTLGARDPYSVRVDYSKYIINGSYIRPSCDVVIKTEPDCIPGSGNKTPSLIPGCEAESLVFDMEAYCLVCPKPARETCGGWLYQHGRCPDGYECLHEVLTKGTFVLYMAPDGRKDGPTGKCIWHQERMALWKDCCSRSKKKMECGSDGNWYPNKCFLYKANGFRKPGAPEIKVIKKDKNSVCKTPPSEDDMCKERSIAACNKVFSIKDKERPKLYYSKDDKPTCGVTRTPTSVSNTAPESVSPSILPQSLQ